jgi:uncharacterized membrane-anchored protein
MSNTGRIPLWLIGLVGGLAVITMLRYLSMVHTRFRSSLL